jgi:hypothetical protein
MTIILIFANPKISFSKPNEFGISDGVRLNFSVGPYVAEFEKFYGSPCVCMHAHVCVQV